ncbi:MAG TPA: hypothetical protein VG737_07160, partial [Cyclobacteriaceae bacterium]|nr:hypothetical protein [Cyclobacteriaceae bacterium]
HDAHTYLVKRNETQLHNHGDHCRLCASDVLFHLYFEPSAEISFYRPQEPVVAIQALTTIIALDDFTRGRAPPVIT